jgi:hypothetical protein
MKANEKINEILKIKKLKAPTFAKKIGMDYQRIFDIQSGKTKKISGEVASAIVSAFPEFNVSWLLSNKGNIGMFKNRNVAQIIDSENSHIIGDNSKVTISDCRNKLEAAMKEIEYLKQRLKDKEEMIEILKGQVKK